MLNLDQVRLLENRVIKAVGKIESLTAENTRLKTQLSGFQTRIGELEGLVRSFKDDQGRIEEGILSALDRLSAFEDSLYAGKETVPAQDTAAVAEQPSVSAEPTTLIVEQTTPSPQQPSAESPSTVDIDAEWNLSGEESQAAVPADDGQMDIF